MCSKQGTSESINNIFCKNQDEDTRKSNELCNNVLLHLKVFVAHINGNFFLIFEAFEITAVYLSYPPSVTDEIHKGEKHQRTCEL
mmetsp:Transcript_32809/g.79820  ORF Transcript_32809/g.79820 Transcript_32809/m.79820 type:complete len:85 (+) Transcript_32809:630-884(+)